MSERERSAAFLQAARTAPWVVKIGGRLCEDRDSRMALARAAAALPHPLVIVHGGGDAVTRLESALGLASEFVEGRRVTAPEQVAVVEMVLSGDVNKSLVRALARAGRPAVGLSGCDAALLQCDLVPGLGRVGTPVRVEVRILELALAAGLVPVVSPVSLGPDGEPVNVNADEAAGALAAALGSPRLLLLSDVEGVRVESAWQEEIEAGAVETLVAAGEATHGMIPKLRAAARAVASGVGEVRIGGFDGAALEEMRGTRIVPHAARLANDGGGGSRG